MFCFDKPQFLYCNNYLYLTSYRLWLFSEKNRQFFTNNHNFNYLQLKYPLTREGKNKIHVSL